MLLMSLFYTNQCVYMHFICSYETPQNITVPRSLVQTWAQDFAWGYWVSDVPLTFIWSSPGFVPHLARWIGGSWFSRWRSMWMYLCLYDVLRCSGIPSRVYSGLVHCFKDRLRIYSDYEAIKVYKKTNKFYYQTLIRIYALRFVRFAPQ